MDPDLGRYETIWAAAGTANSVFQLTPATLRVLANAVVTQIAVRPDEPRPPELKGLPDDQRPPEDQRPVEESTEQQAAGAPSGAPDIYLPGVQTGSWVFAVGNDWDSSTARVPVSGQVLQHQWLDTRTGDTF